MQKVVLLFDLQGGLMLERTGAQGSRVTLDVAEGTVLQDHMTLADIKAASNNAARKNINVDIKTCT